jgi:hypothetical protein
MRVWRLELDGGCTCADADMAQCRTGLSAFVTDAHMRQIKPRF